MRVCYVCTRVCACMCIHECITVPCTYVYTYLYVNTRIVASLFFFSLTRLYDLSVYRCCKRTTGTIIIVSPCIRRRRRRRSSPSTYVLVVIVETVVAKKEKGDSPNVAWNLWCAYERWCSAREKGICENARKIIRKRKRQKEKEREEKEKEKETDIGDGWCIREKRDIRCERRTKKKSVARGSSIG